MSGNVIGFPPRSEQRVPTRYEVVHHGGVINGINVEVWRTKDSNSIEIVLSPTAGGQTFVGHFGASTLDIAVLIAQTVTDTLRAAAETWEPALPPAG